MECYECMLREIDMVFGTAPLAPEALDAILSEIAQTEAVIADGEDKIAHFRDIIKQMLGTNRWDLRNSCKSLH